MSLKSPRSIAFLLALPIAVAMVTASCGGSQPSTVAPSSLSSSAAGADGSARVTTSGEVTAQDDAPPPPAPTPAPPPPPSPYSPDTDPGPFPAPPIQPKQRPIFWTPTSENAEWLTLKIDFNPVQFSGQPIPLQACEALPHTWFYKQTIHSRTGNIFRIVERENYFDGYLSSRTSVNIEIPGQQNVDINTRWCSSFGKAHTAQHRFKAVGPDNRIVILNGPIIQLQQNPSYVPPPPAAPHSTTMRDGALTVWGD